MDSQANISASSKSVSLGSDSHPLIPMQPKPTETAVSSAVINKCIAYLLIIISLGYILYCISISRTDALHWSRQLISSDIKSGNSSLHQEIGQKLIRDAILYAIKNLFPITLIAVLVYLQRAVLVPGTATRASVRSDKSGSQIILTDVDRDIEMSERLGKSEAEHFPSQMLMITYLVFFTAYCVSSFASIVLLTFELHHSEKSRTIAATLDIVRQAILLVATVLQTKFFVVHFKRSIQWKLGVSYFCLTHIYVTNVVLWFFTADIEVWYASATQTKFSNSNPLMLTTGDVNSRLRYTFSTVYFTISCLIAMEMEANIGVDGSILQKCVKGSSNEFVHGRWPSFGMRRSKVHWEFTAIRNCAFRFFTGICAMAVYVVASLYSRSLNDKTSCVSATDMVLQGALIVNICGIACAAWLLRILQASSEHQLSSAYSLDRAVLGKAWIIVTIDLCKLIQAVVTIVGPPFAPNHLVMLCSCALNSAQSLLQMRALELALARKFRCTGVGAHGVLTVLILLNISQLMISALSFKFFQCDGLVNGLETYIILMLPWQVLYRFHSAACLLELKMRKEDLSSAVPGC